MAGLRDRVALLYSTLDASLEFHPPDSAPAAGTDASPKPDANPDTAELDLSGVACPMNFVKAKLKLETLPLGAVLTLLLDDGEPARNVPASFRNEGQEILGMTALNDTQWKIEVKKTKE